MNLQDVSPVNDQAIAELMDRLPGLFPGCIVALMVAVIDRNEVVTDLSCMANADPEDVVRLLKDVVENNERDQRRSTCLH